jgi:hypothetical protein
MLFDAIFLTTFVLGWLICGYLPWLVLSVATRGGAGLKYLPLCLFAGLVAGLSVPVLGFDGWWGLGASFALAAVIPALLLLVRPGPTPIARNGEE